MILCNILRFKRLTFCVATPLFSLLPFAANASDVIPTGSTATQVTSGADGHLQVDLANSQSGVSYNSFSRFDVGSAGVTLNNTDSGARTIVNEVFSAAPSRFEGTLTLEGPRANLIMANQNGLLINGGEFINFGSVALTTGAVRFEDRMIGGDTPQRYVWVDTAQGGIDIGAKGLAAELINLELIAREVNINGPVTNRFTSSTARTRIVAGESTTFFDTVASPTDNLTPWAHPEKGESATTDVLFSVNAAGGITSGTVNVLVTDKGAGVRNAGELLATMGGFTLNSSGLLEQQGGTIKGQGTVLLESASLEQYAGDGQQSRIESTASFVDIKADEGVINQDSYIGGAQPVDPDETAALSITTKGKIDNITTVGAEHGAILFSQDGDIVLNATEGILNRNSRFIANGELIMNTDGAAINESVFLPADNLEEVSYSSESWGGLTRENGYSIARGELADPDHMAYWVAQGDVKVNAGDVLNEGGFIFANDGDVDLLATGKVVNRAWLTGELQYTRSCVLFICKRKVFSSEQLQGGSISASEQVILKGGELIENHGGTVLGMKGGTLDAPVIRAVGQPVHFGLTRASGLKALFGDTWAKLYSVDQGGSFTAQQGKWILLGAAELDRGQFIAPEGIEGEITVLQLPERDPVRIENHLGLLRW
ncbi:filamentous hemagglutinin N-terminal domain-containing protein [Nitrincola sp. MINF-07-Sa-05]|uniref:filamentous hemagglutinin N-terminal domain-containing protein n=1 Tax=Nitrincola salilacus TaxID=3400273 RepID=UPI003917C904